MAALAAPVPPSPPPPLYTCEACMALVGAGPYVEPHAKLEAVPAAGRDVLRCARCNAQWALKPLGWARADVDDYVYYPERNG